MNPQLKPEPTQADRELVAAIRKKVCKHVAWSQNDKIPHVTECLECLASELAAVQEEAHEAGHKCEKSIIEIDGDGKVTPDCIHKLGPLKGVRDE